MVVYLLTTADEYELPLAVADSGVELARMIGVSRKTVYSTIFKAEHRGSRCRYHRVEIDEEDEDEE